jgi:hypothetical protein
MAAARRCVGPAACGCCCTVGAEKPSTRVADVGYEAAVEGELEDDARLAWKERNLYGPGVVHDGGVPQGSSNDPLVRSPVLLRPPVEALLPRGRCESYDLS